MKVAIYQPGSSNKALSSQTDKVIRLDVPDSIMLLEISAAPGQNSVGSSNGGASGTTNSGSTAPGKTTAPKKSQPANSSPAATADSATPTNEAATPETNGFSLPGIFQAVSQASPVTVIVSSIIIFLLLLSYVVARVLFGRHRSS